MYHKVGALTNGISDTFVNVTAASFSRQMSVMSRMGYVAVTFADVLKSFYGGLALPRKCFVITFDDGYQSVSEHAAPILERYKFPATVFAVSGMVGRTNEWDEVGGRPIHPLMSWDELCNLQSTGWEIAGHTMTHPHLNRLSASAALCEVENGKREIEARLGTRVESFCYPYGDYADNTPDVVRKAGYLGACTTKSGLATARKSLFLLPRVKISHSDDVAGLLYKLHLRPMLPTFRREGCRTTPNAAVN
jgi:peptidoglycan/xylan/chitin deacetylase (PgdA/CDA1 family)